ncbi:MAG TPA: hypothetical protein VJ583_00850 [Nitrososphaeraceae archaeon]|jgi:hypothetical protein|nr:hypothetical protein [Nitrososphaeraceae archaeon]
MVYSDYISSLLSYQKVTLTQEERSFIIKFIRGHDQSFKITSYFKLRNQSAEQRDASYLISKRLEDMGFIEVTKGKFLSNIKNYKFTTYGLFYIFLNISIYPPQFLIKYQDDIILKTLIFQFFNEKTIKICTGRFYSQITSYLQECCNVTLNAIDDIKSADENEEEKVKIIDRLKFDLEWLIRRLCFKLTIMYSETNLLSINPNLTDDVKVTLYELETKMKLQLSKDSQFINLLKNLYKDFNEGYSELVNLNNENSDNMDK